MALRLRLLFLLCSSALILTGGGRPVSPDEGLDAMRPSIISRRHLAPATTRNSISSSFSSSSSSSSSSPHQKQGSGKRKALWYAELLAGAVTGFILGTLFVMFMLGFEEEKEKPRNVFGYTALDPEIEWAAALSSLCREEDGGLKPFMEVIGRGACGVVYKAEMPTGGGGGGTTIVAIKRVDGQPAVSTAQLCSRDKHSLDKAARQIRSEVMTAGFLRHPNILPVLAHVYRNDRQYLVYEYMKNGSLHDALKAAREGTAELSWPVRFRIARGVAAGLEYLHAVHRPAVIHRDLKPANILLDDAMEARISDFGLAKEAAQPDGLTVTTSNVAGTIGYIAPEYYQVMRFTDKCDVYGYGVILAALVTGRLPTDRFFQTTDEMCLVGWLRSAMRSEDPAAAAVDRKLLGNGFEAQMVLTLKIACFCTYDNPGHRPTMRDVRCMLSQIKH